MSDSNSDSLHTTRMEIPDAIAILPRWESEHSKTPPAALSPTSAPSHNYDNIPDIICEPGPDELTPSNRANLSRAQTRADTSGVPVVFGGGVSTDPWDETTDSHGIPGYDDYRNRWMRRSSTSSLDNPRTLTGRRKRNIHDPDYYFESVSMPIPRANNSSDSSEHDSTEENLPKNPRTPLPTLEQANTKRREARDDSHQDNIREGFDNSRDSIRAEVGKIMRHDNGEVPRYSNEIINEVLPESRVPARAGSSQSSQSSQSQLQRDDATFGCRGSVLYFKKAADKDKMTLLRKKTFNGSAHEIIDGTAFFNHDFSPRQGGRDKWDIRWVHLPVNNAEWVLPALICILIKTVSPDESGAWGAKKVAEKLFKPINRHLHHTNTSSNAVSAQPYDLRVPPLCRPKPLQPDFLNADERKNVHHCAENMVLAVIITTISKRKCSGASRLEKRCFK
ncbi:hypothetical protein TWF481_001231 [Arthrobotrys musiformis]|uniref:Uncharacterized protein n=1 Tax=Arthrobotrys musiformis TaxID=47236 RepID=A0AAV9WPX5_9PEZI